jgi:ketosteroid isomerase-like protein
MKLIWVYSLCLICLLGCKPSGRDETEQVRTILQNQTAAWNRGDLEGFMQTYWKNDSLLFIGKSGVHRGWSQTLSNYKKGYPDTASMGKLSFDILELKRLSPEYFYVVGKWMLKRSVGDLSGYFNLLVQRIDGKWVIIADHSS